MRVVIGAVPAYVGAREQIVQHLQEHSDEVTVLPVRLEDNFVTVTDMVVNEVMRDAKSLGIVIDSYGVGPFMVASKVKGMIAAVVSDERSAYMCRAHNNARILTIGAELLGPTLLRQIVTGFVEGTYDAGRHQVRVDMLNQMC